MIKSLIALTLAIILLALILGTSDTRGRASYMGKAGARTTATINVRALADSVLIAVCQSFGLTDSAFEDSILIQKPGISGPPFHRFRQSWPMELPFFVFAQRLSQKAFDNQLSCDCLEFQKGASLDCVLKSGLFMGVEVVLDTDRKTKLANREVAIVIDNLGSFRDDDIGKLISSGGAFSYFAAPDIFPSGNIQKLLSRSQITAILRVPGGKAQWLRLIRLSRSEKRFQGRIAQPNLSEALIEEVFRRHPTTKIIGWLSSNDMERPVVSAILDRAGRNGMAYLYTNKAPSFADSLAYSKGLAMIRWEADEQLIESSFPNIRLYLLNRLLSEDKGSQVILILDAVRISAEEMLDLKALLDKLGVKLRPCMKLAEMVESL